MELARGSDAKADWVVKAFDTIARTDADAMVRVEALRGLSASAGPATVPTLVKLLNSAEAPVADVKPAAPGPVRWEAALLLERLASQAKIADADRDSALTALLARAERDADRNVRLTAISALRYVPNRRVLPVLVNALRSRDFAIQHRAEQSLHYLTGQTHDNDADGWDHWLAATPDPFTPAPPAPPPRSWWSRLVAGR